MFAERGPRSIGLAAVRTDQIERTNRLRLDFGRSTTITKRRATLFAEGRTIREGEIAFCAMLHGVGLVGLKVS